jgi:hypothetical protein
MEYRSTYRAMLPAAVRTGYIGAFSATEDVENRSRLYGQFAWFLTRKGRCSRWRLSRSWKSPEFAPPTVIALIVIGAYPGVVKVTDCAEWNQRC